MLSRLSGLANTVLHELSGDGEDAGSEASPAEPEMEASQPNGEEAAEDVLERLAHTERLVVQLKDLVREKDAQLQQKDVQLQDERQAAEAKLLKLKMQAKAKLASLNKRMEELTGRGAALPAGGLPGEPVSPAQVESEQRPQDSQAEETEILRRQLREQEEAMGKLQQRLEAATGSLQEAQAQLTALQEETQEKESRLEEQARQHQAELRSLMASSAPEVEIQQKLRALQQKLEEQEAALLGRTQVVELLQQELNTLEEQKKALLEKCQKAEAEADSLRNTLTSERRESQSRAEKLELELAEQKLAFHRLQEEAQHLSQELAEARAARADLEQRSQAAEQRHAEEMAQKGHEMADLQRAEKDLRSCYEALQDENTQLRRDLSRPHEISTGELPEQPHGPGWSRSAADAEEAGQVIPLESKPVSEQSTAALPVRDGEEQDRDQERKAAAEAPEKAETETLSREPALLEDSPGFTEDAGDSTQVGGAETVTEEHSQLPFGGSSAFEDSSPELRGQPLEDAGSLESHRSQRGEELPSSPEAQPIPFGSPQEMSRDTESSPTDLLEYLSEKKHQDLSVLLLELQEAQEEIAFLRGQLPLSSHLEAEQAQPPPLGGPLQDRGGGEGGGGGEERLALTRSDSSSRALVTVDIQEEASPLAGTPSPPDGSCADGQEGAPELPSISVLQVEVAELRARQQEAEELHKGALEEREAQIRRLQHLLEDSEGTLCTLRAERGQILSQLEELRALAELREQVTQLEGDLAASEKHRLSDYEKGLSRLALLEEEIQSLNNQAGSKEVKISALQKDLDEAQHRLAEQDLLAKSLAGQLQKGEHERAALAGQLQEASVQAEELSRSRTAAEQEVARLEKLLSESSGEIERLRQQVTEREEQMAEVSHSMSDRMVQLNEEKVVLGKELQSLTERLSLLLQAKPTSDQGVGTEDDAGAEPPTERAVSTNQEAEGLRKEHEQVKKKLQAALVSRKELLSRVRRLERELEVWREEPAKPGAKGPEVQEEEEEEDNHDNREEDAPGSDRNARGDPQPTGHGRDTHLSQPLSAKEAELQAALGEKDSEAVSLQATLAKLQQSLWEKDLRIGVLQADLEALRSAPERQPSGDQSAGSSSTAAPLVQERSGAVGHALEEEPPRAGSEERISALEQEKEQLQKKLQEALASRKETIKKAQEKDRHHREQLKQQKDDYGFLQEQLEQRVRENESLQEQLRALSKILETPSLPKPDEEVPPAVGVLHDSGRKGSPEGAPAGGHLLAPEGLPMEQLKADLENLRDAKRELEAQVSSLEGELAGKSAAILKLQEESRELLAELERAKGACCQAEASAASLRLELDQSQAEVARLENLRLQQAEQQQQEEEEEEEKALARKEDIDSLNSQLAEKCESVRHLKAQLQEREEVLQALRGQLEAQAQERPRVEAAEAQQKSAEDASRAQLQRKLQAALISRKEALKESKALKEELAGTKAALEKAESQASELVKEKGALLEKLAAVGEEREKLIAEVDRALVESQDASSSCESLKLALEGVTREKARWEEEAGARQRAHAQELSEWQRKHQELQKEYETLLQSYENVSDEAERMQRVVESVRQEKQELFLRLKDAEAEKREAEARWQGAEQEMEGMREKMRKFAKSKQQKILELEEENERLRAEVPPAGEEGSGGGEEASAHLREELENSQRNCQALAGQLEALLAEKETLNQQIQELRRSPQSQAEVTGKSSWPEESFATREVVSSTRTVPLEKAAAAADETPPGTSASEPPEPAAGQDGGPSHDEINGYIQQVAQLSEQVGELEERRRVVEEELSRVQRDLEAIGAEKRSLEELLAAKGQEVEVLREKVLVMEQAGQKAEEQLAGARRLREALEAEKDALEERLMNQLAELNGSIGNYQQDVADLQSKNQQLRSQVESLRESLSGLEDEKRRLLREKSEAEAEKKEHQEKLRSSWKGDGRRSQAKELQELLKEKQQEVRQLQRDCIKSQERASSLERTVKALEFVQSESQKELEATRRKLEKAGEDTARAQAELASCRVMLDDTQGEAARVLAEILKVKEEHRASEAQVKAQLRQKEKDLEGFLEEEKSRHREELRDLRERLEASRREQARSEGAAEGLRESLRQKDQEAKQLQGSLNHTLAQLAAFTKSMSSLQDDRDRVIDESRQWERKFSEAIEKKEREVQARKEACAALQEQVEVSAAQVEDLQSLIASLEQDKSAQESRAHQERQRHQEEVRMLQEEKGDLLSQLKETQQLLSQSQDQVQKQEAELGNWREQLSRLQESFAHCKGAQDEAEKRVKSQEADLQECRFHCEQLEADLQASKALTDQLHREMSTKDQKMMQLLAAQEEALTVAVSELQQKHQEELKSLEDRTGRAEAEKVALEMEKKDALEKVDHLTEKLRSAREESKQLKAQLDSFTKSMSSLQDDRDRVLEDYRQLEQRHLEAILEKDQLIQEAATENNTLKEELRSLHGRLDDLHAENAKLDAELVRYREDLNQVISIKDCQQKQLLKAQREHIRALEKEKAATEGQLRESERALADLQREKQQLEQEADTLKASLSQLENNVAALGEVGPVSELQAQLQAKVDEALALGGQLSLAQQRTRELEEEVASLEEATAQRMQEAEAEMKKELQSLRHDAGLMRNETETAEERVAELAKDLLEMEQNLLAVTEENQDLKAQIHSFQKAMGSLQDSWDQSQEELRALEKKSSRDVEEQRLLVQSLSKEKAHLQEQQKHLSEEREALASQLATLQSSVEEKGLVARLDQLGQQLQAKDMELLRLTAELEGASGQVKSFSKAMASLQGERDRLLSALEKARKEEELQLQSAASASASPAEVLSLKKALSALQSDRDRLLVELKKLQQQYLQAGVDTAEMTRLKAQLQEQQQEVERQRSLQVQLKEQSASLQSELQQLREEKATRQPAVTMLSEEQPRAMESTKRPSAQFLEEDRHQRQVATESARSGKPLKGDAPGPGADAEDVQAQLRSTLKELHQKELRIQQLNSKLSQVFEEKNSLSLQLRGSSCSLRESHQRFNEVLARCEALEKQLQAGQTPGQGREDPPTDAAPGAPQERSEHTRESYTPELQELQMKLSEAKEQQSQAKEGLLQLEELLQAERDQRLAAEEAFSSAQDHIRRLESAEWTHSGGTSIDIPPTPEHRLLVGPSESSFSKARGGTGGLRRVLRSLFCSRRRLPLLATVYLLAVHVLLLLCFTGHL